MQSRSKTETLFPVGQIVKAQGIKGEVKIDCWLDDSKLLSALTALWCDKVEKRVRAIRCDGRFCYVRFEDVDDMNAAEMLRGKTVSARKEDIPLSEGRYFVDDLIGCEVFSDGKSLGKVIDILKNSQTDVFDIMGEKEVLFPWVKDLTLSVDVIAKKIVVDSEKLKEVIVDAN